MKLPVPDALVFTEDLSNFGLHFSDDSAILLPRDGNSLLLPTKLSSIKVSFTNNERAFHSIAFNGDTQLVIGS